ncbi:hypothetical protein BDW68DRAFT_150649 [Aspergillus falconensis]
MGRERISFPKSNQTVVLFTGPFTTASTLLPGNDDGPRIQMAVLWTGHMSRTLLSYSSHPGED